MSPLTSSPLFYAHTYSQRWGSPASPLPSPHTLPSASSPPLLSSVSRYYREVSKALEMLGEDGGRRRSTLVGSSESRQTVNSSDAMTTWQLGSGQAARRAFQEYACDIFKNKSTDTHRVHALTHTSPTFQEKDAAAEHLMRVGREGCYAISRHCSTITGRTPAPVIFTRHFIKLGF